MRTATQDGKPVPKMKVYNIRDGIFEALLYRFAIDPTMVAFGEENRDWGGAFAVYRGLTEALPYHRLFNARSRKPASWARPWDTRWRAAAWWPS